MHYVTGTASELGTRLVSALGTYRHKVFVQQLGWDLPDATEDAEWDRFDRHDTVYVVALNPVDGVTGCARLLPTTRDYLLADVFSQLLDGAPAPQSCTTWELSRFAAVDAGAPPGAPHTLGSSRSLALLRVSMQAAISRGARTLVSVSPVAIQRILRHGGFEYKPLGQTHRVDGHSLFACSMTLLPALNAASGCTEHLPDHAQHHWTPASKSPQLAIRFKRDSRVRGAYRARNGPVPTLPTTKD